MADTKITALTAITTVDPAVDVFPIVDVSDTTMAASGTTKKITSNQLLGAGGTATLASATITGDLTVDTSTLKVDSANNRVGIVNASPTTALDVVGTITATASTATGYNLVYDTASITTGRVQSRLRNTSGAYVAGLEGGTAGASLTGSAAYSAYAGSFGAYPFYLVSNSAIQATLDSSGNLGLGVTPSAWVSTVKALDLSSGGAVYAGSLNCGLAANYYLNSSGNYIYKTTAFAAGYIPNYANNGSHVWFNAPSGTAGNAITFTQAMTLDASGNLLVGTTAQTGRLDIATANGVDCKFGMLVTGTQRWQFIVNNSTAAFSIYDQTNSRTAVSIDSLGNIVSNITGTAPSLGSNGQLVVNATSNTNLRFSYRGSDGVTRVANLTLA